jgi:hypothetical protein
VRSIYTKRFLVVNQSTFGEAPCPIGKRWVVKMISAWNNGGTATAVSVNVNNVRLWTTSVAGGAGTFATDLYLVANAGEILTLVGANGACNMGAFGFELDAT